LKDHLDFENPIIEFEEKIEQLARAAVRPQVGGQAAYPDGGHDKLRPGRPPRAFNGRTINKRGFQGLILRTFRLEPLQALSAFTMRGRMNSFLNPSSFMGQCISVP